MKEELSTAELVAWIKQLMRDDNIIAFYKSAYWHKLRAQVLAEQHYECQRCKDKGLAVPAETVHHIQHVRRRPDLALTKSNLLVLCKECHYEEHHKNERIYLTVERW